MGHTIKLGEPSPLTRRTRPSSSCSREAGPPATSSCPTLAAGEGAPGYFYVLDLRRGDEQPIIDALQIYDVRDERGDEHELEFLWRDDGLVAILFVDDVAQALIDFDEPRFMSRTGFPAPGPDSPVTTHEWDQTA